MHRNQRTSQSSGKFDRKRLKRRKMTSALVLSEFLRLAEAVSWWLAKPLILFLFMGVNCEIFDVVQISMNNSSFS